MRKRRITIDFDEANNPIDSSVTLYDDKGKQVKGMVSACAPFDAAEDVLKELVVWQADEQLPFDQST
jgi:hypothetical protein